MALADFHFRCEGLWGRILMKQINSKSLIETVHSYQAKSLNLAFDAL